MVHNGGGEEEVASELVLLRLWPVVVGGSFSLDSKLSRSFNTEAM
jgi:hypothetical protein